MNASEIIKSIENEQLKAEAPEFSVGHSRPEGIFASLGR